MRMNYKNIIKKYKYLPVSVKAAMWFLACSFLQKSISVITTPVFTRILNTQEYGQYNVFHSWMNLITIIVTLNLSHGVYAQGIIKFEEHKNVFSSSLQGLTIFLILVWSGFYLIFHEFWNRIFSLTTIQMMAMLIMIWMSAVYSFWATEQRSELKYKTLVFVTLMSSVFKIILSLFFISVMQDSVTARILGMVFGELLFFAWMFFVQIYRGKRVFSRFYWRYSITFCIPLIPHYLSQAILNSADRIMIEKMVNTSAAGIYGLAYSISQIMSIFNLALQHTMEPWIYRRIKENKVNSIAELSYILFIIIGIVNLVLMILAPEAVKVFAPEPYYSAIWVIPPVAMSVFFQFLYSIFACFEFYYEKTAYITVATLGSGVLNILLNAIMIPRFGFIAAGYTTLISYIFYTLFHYCIMEKIIKNNMKLVNEFDTKKILFITVIFMASGFMIQIFYFCTWIRLGIFGIIWIVVFAKYKKIIKYFRNCRVNSSDWKLF